MQKPLILFAAICGLSLMTACPGSSDTDAGVEDGGGEGEGEGEGEDLRAEGDTCDPSRTDQCESGLVCIPGQLNPSVGVCRVDCSANEDSCPSNRTCQDILSAELDYLGTACVPQQSQRDGACQAWSDPDACASDMMCSLTVFTEDAAGNTVTNFNCKVTCDKDADDLNAECAGDERCFPSPFIQGFQPNPSNPQELVSCTLDNCAEGGSGCECDTGNGFECVELTSGPACVMVPGQCGTPVPPVLPENIVPGGITAELVCNTVDGHAFCDDSMVNEESTSICLDGIFGASAPNDGICFAFCGNPTADYNGDGSITDGSNDSDDETGAIFECAAGWACTDDTAMALGIGVDIADTTTESGARECDPSACTEGEPCPAQCGEGDYQCATFGEGNDAVSLCFAPYLACVPETTDSDAGPTSDAGTTETDAGSTSDAGTTETDAGSTSDAGTTETDAGSSSDAGSSDAG